MPSDLSLDDWTQYVCLKDFGYMLPIASPQRAMEVFQAEFDAAWKYGALWIAVWHPFVSGRMSRRRHRGADQAHAERGGLVRDARGDRRARAAVIASGRWTPRVEQLPFYERPLSGVVLTGSGVVPG